MSTSADTDEIAKVILSHKFAKPREIEAAREWGERAHPDKDLAELLFMRGVFDRAKVGLIRKMAKMSRTSSSRTPRPPQVRDHDLGAETVAPPAAPKADVKITVRDLRTSPPDRIGKYEILEKVAQGGMGVIFKARHVELDRVFALKVLTPRTEANEEATARFQREAKTAARLDHPNIVRVHDAGVEQGAPYLVMDFIDGSNIGDLLKEEGFGVRKAAQIARSIALALHHAHENGVVHRDVKPDNIIVDTASGEPKITDFGIVKELGETQAEESKLTQTGYTLGSPCYMSPEQAAGDHDQVDVRSDVYSLAATLYEMLCESPPHDGESIHEIMTKVVREDPVSVGRRNPQVPRDLDVVVMKALEKDLDRRYATARAFAEDLGRFLNEEPVLAKPAGPATKLWRKVRRHRAVSALLLVFIVAAVSGLGWVWAWQRQLAHDAREARESRLARAETLRAMGEAAADPRTKRRAYYEAIIELNAVLDGEPRNERAREAKRVAVLALGDHLIESGDASFAEFVFALGAGVADTAEIASRIEAARLGIWVEKAEAAELAGDLQQAHELYLKGMRALQEAGFEGQRLQARIDDLDDQLADQRQREGADKLVRLAEASAAEGDHLAAYLAYQRAQAIIPEDREVTGRLEYHRGKIEEDHLLLRRAALALRDQVETARQSLKGTSPELEGALPDGLAEGDEAVIRASAAQEQERFAAATSELKTAKERFARCYSLVGALRGREVARAEATLAEKRKASEFAPTELGFAKDFQFRADQAFEKGEFEEAADFYTRASSFYRRAARTGGTKSVVADARAEAQRVRNDAFAALTREQRSPRFTNAEADYQRAEKHYDQREYTPARDLYLKATASFRAELLDAPAIREAYAARAKVLGLREAATNELAREYASDDFSRARQAELTADQALSENDPARASSAYAEALYRYRRAVTKARPHAESKREYDALLLQVQDARQYCVDEQLEWKPAFKRGEERLGQAEEALQRRYWNGAKRHLERALRDYLSLQK